ncbi:methyltransferase TRM13 family protein [Clostridioides difficile 824]|uniref:class I SAM-dependent methyltransferase n=3 Tax=Clostridioides difficile TaxID=1496 RepID=UPI00038D4F0B|nr:SAM-dependent methyltransferase [Clostridioides difficile]OFU41812.1 SAM-dependent methyltransferase [Clostridium sp. HMSC19B04]OFU42980.1 SAM-dependent methyltransferase [Clostridium sp. HMSC19A11]AXU59618.1 SAM dependent methyltransferase [Clostridioides difficile]EGT4720565.1 SAM-dependent methyltransferase [Clostridioides difficile]EQF97509.1 methyltransferase TRM13 family protein [Clostridioides difficile 824]
MNKQSIGKLNMFFMGITQRNLDNRDFFIELEVIFKSGRKEFKGIAIEEDNKYKFNFKGKSDLYMFNELLKNISKEAENYDGLVFKYVERGTIVVIEGDNKKVNVKYLDNKEEVPKIDEFTASQIKNRDYYVKVGQANALLKEIGVLTKDGKIKNDKIRKYNQIDHFVELIDSILKEIKDKDCITILDCACGKSYLSFVLNFYIKEVLKKNCYFIGIDYSDVVIEASKNMAKNLGYKNMSFIKEDLTNYTPNRDVDLVISLHACDTATDMAIGLGIRAKSEAIVVVPCCHKELLGQYRYEAMEPILKHGVFKARFADLITDGLRTLLLEGNGYDTSVVEYISPLDTPKNLMIRAIKTKTNNDKALKEYKELKSQFGVEPTLEKLIY